MLPKRQEKLVSVSDEAATQDAEALKLENGVFFDIENEDTYPPEYTFVVINLLPNVPVYFDREQNTWWTATISKGDKDIYGFNDLYHYESDVEIFWQPIEFKKADVLFIPAGE
ncbi:MULTISPECIES: hypothetical protein [Vibrio]|uniref:hypothetical protein n=1 Tax=Vibrio TaxID=662 RepID=UPI0020752B05|nr:MULTISPECIES: hypothetical protein [Vibrio]USD35629.1 hypothetical protein J8Z27_22740 [Vibrio sp. SCSIO 43186]USD72753.1 hypothetical protein J4N41_22745 [Vibrio sp. SCSIO 43139]USD98958.1 hypothetical protein CTT30_23070 [Vibrio coralliilyticus]